MKIAILGGGYTGISASYDLRKAGHEVTLFEKEAKLGGLASGFNNGKWEWDLDRAYHHIFQTDTDILNFARELNAPKFEFSQPVTASLYETPTGWKQFDLGTPISLLRFPLLGVIDKIRASATLAFLKLSPPLAIFEKMTAKDFLVKTMGQKSWEILWQPLFQKKFGKYAEKILAIFFWARIKKRTQALGYPIGGFQALTDHFESKLIEIDVEIKKGHEVKVISKTENGFEIDGVKFDKIISTLPTRVLAKVFSNILPSDYLVRINSLKYLHAINCIVASPTKPLDKSYWLSLCIPSWGAMVAVQQTNYVKSVHYGGQELLYIAKYVDDDDPLLRATDDEIFRFFTDPLKNINSSFDPNSGEHWIFKAGLAQPIFDIDFPTSKPDFISPISGLFIANLDMTYPYDRGTNYAVQLGRKVAKMINES